MCKKAFGALGMVQRAMPNSTPCCSHSQLATVKLVTTSIPVLSSFIYKLKWKQYDTSSIFPQLRVKVHPRTGHESPEGEEKYSAALSLTLVLDGGGVGGQDHTPATLPLGEETWYPLYRKLRKRLDRCRKTRPIGIWSLDRPACSRSL